MHDRAVPRTGPGHRRGPDSRIRAVAAGLDQRPAGGRPARRGHRRRLLRRPQPHRPARAQPAAAGVPSLAGVGLSGQMAVNGRLNVTARTPSPSVTLNFLLGAVVLGTALGVDVAVRGLPRQWPHHPVLYTGGLLGLLFVLASVVVVRHIGVLVMGLAMVAGQTIGALVLDATASGGAGVGLGAVASSALILVAAVLASHTPRT